MHRLHRSYTKTGSAHFRNCKIGIKKMSKYLKNEKMNFKIPKTEKYIYKNT